MYEYRVHTLVDITDNGNLKKAFPFKTEATLVEECEKFGFSQNEKCEFLKMRNVCFST